MFQKIVSVTAIVKAPQNENTGKNNSGCQPKKSLLPIYFLCYDQCQIYQRFRILKLCYG